MLIQNLGHFFNIWSNSRSDLLGLEKLYKLLKSWSTYWIILFESFFFFFFPDKKNLQNKDVLVSIWKALYIISHPVWLGGQVHKTCFSSSSRFLALQLFYTFWCYIYPLWKETIFDQAACSSQRRKEAEHVKGRILMRDSTFTAGHLPKAPRVNWALHLCYLLWLNCVPLEGS